MTAFEIVEALLNESVFVGNNGRPKGWLGIVDITRGTIRAQWSEDIVADDHSEMGRNAYWFRWRYATNRVRPTVMWTTDPSEHPEVKTMVEEWLDKKGFMVLSHTTDFNMWMGY